MLIALPPLVLALIAYTQASPIDANPAAVVNEHPLITPAPTTWDPTKTRNLDRRDILSDVGVDVKSVISDLGNVPSYVASGVPNFFQDFPTGAGVQSSLGLDDSQVAALPTQVLNIP